MTITAFTTATHCEAFFHFYFDDLHCGSFIRQHFDFVFHITTDYNYPYTPPMQGYNKNKREGCILFILNSGLRIALPMDKQQPPTPTYIAAIPMASI